MSRKGAVTLNDMKDMLADLPQFQEMREKVPLTLPRTSSSYWALIPFINPLSLIVLLCSFVVFAALEHGADVDGPL